MVRPGVHFPRTMITLVLRNGATVQVPSILTMAQPWFLNKVRSLSLSERSQGLECTGVAAACYVPDYLCACASAQEKWTAQQSHFAGRPFAVPCSSRVNDIVLALNQTLGQYSCLQGVFRTLQTTQHGQGTRSPRSPRSLVRTDSCPSLATWETQHLQSAIDRAASEALSTQGTRCLQRYLGVSGARGISHLQT